jgi:hypothetical protein
MLYTAGKLDTQFCCVSNLDTKSYYDYFTFCLGSDIQVKYQCNGHILVVSHRTYMYFSHHIYGWLTVALLTYPTKTKTDIDKTC